MDRRAHACSYIP